MHRRLHGLAHAEGAVALREMSDETPDSFDAADVAEAGLPTRLTVPLRALHAFYGTRGLRA